MEELSSWRFTHINELVKMPKKGIIAALGFDSLLSITDYRSSLYLATLLFELSSKANTVFFVTSDFERWSNVIQYAEDYQLKAELHYRSTRKLPPYSIPVRLSGPDQDRINTLIRSIDSSILYKGSWQAQGGQYSITVLFDRDKPIPPAFFSDRHLKIDIFPNFIDAN
jgi:primosomal protein N'